MEKINFLKKHKDYEIGTLVSYEYYSYVKHERIKRIGVILDIFEQKHDVFGNKNILSYVFANVFWFQEPSSKDHDIVLKRINITLLKKVGYNDYTIN